MKHRIICGVCVIGAVLALGCGGSQGARPSRITVQSNPMPAGGGWDGVFQSPAYGRMEFTVSGSEVTGLYEGERHFGKIEGTIDGDVLNFKWMQWNEDLQGKLRSKKGHGYFRYTMEEEQGAKTSHVTHKIDGEWGYDDDNAGNNWSAVKLREGTKKTLKPHSESETGENGSEEYAESAGFNAGSEPSSGPSAQPSGDSHAVPEGTTSGESIDNLF